MEKGHRWRQLDQYPKVRFCTHPPQYTDVPTGLSVIAYHLQTNVIRSIYSTLSGSKQLVAFSIFSLFSFLSLCLSLGRFLCVAAGAMVLNKQYIKHAMRLPTCPNIVQHSYVHICVIVHSIRIYIK